MNDQYRVAKLEQFLGSNARNETVLDMVKKVQKQKLFKDVEMILLGTLGNGLRKLVFSFGNERQILPFYVDPEMYDAIKNHLGKNLIEA